MTDEAEGPTVSRRQFVRTSLLVGGAFAVGVGVGYGIERSGNAPRRRRAAFEVRAFGAKGNGSANDTGAIQRAIDAAAKVGGIVVFSGGTYLSGTLRLRSRVQLELGPGAVLLGSANDADYAPQEKLPYQTYSDSETSDFANALLAGDGLEQVSIVGVGVIDANRTKRFGPKPIALRRCHQVQVRGITIRNSPNYCISLGGCDDVQIDGVTIRNAYADGIDPDACRRVHISNCDIESDDDSIVFKTSLILDERVPTEDVTVTGCTLRSYANCFKIGTETSGDVRNVAVSNCTMLGTPDRDARRGPGDENAGIAIEMVDGAVLEGVVVSNVVMRQVLTPVFVRLGNRGRGQQPPTTGALRNVSIRNVVATAASETSSITGLAGHPVQRVSIDGLHVTTHGGAATAGSLDVPEQVDQYPEARMFGVLPAAGLYVRHAEQLLLRDVRVTTPQPDARAGLVADDVAGLDIEGYEAVGPAAPLWLNAVHDGLVRGSMLHGEPRITGPSTVQVVGNS